MIKRKRFKKRSGDSWRLADFLDLFFFNLKLLEVSTYINNTKFRIHLLACRLLSKTFERDVLLTVYSPTPPPTMILHYVLYLSCIYLAYLSGKLRPRPVSSVVSVSDS